MVVNKYSYSKKEHSYKVLEDEETIMTLRVDISDEKAEIYNFGIRFRNDNFLRKGYGSFLIKNVLEDLKKQKIKEVELEASSCFSGDPEDKRLTQKELIKFYRKRGFKRKSFDERYLKWYPNLSKRENKMLWINQSRVPMILKDLN